MLLWAGVVVKFLCLGICRMVPLCVDTPRAVLNEVCATFASCRSGPLFLRCTPHAAYAIGRSDNVSFVHFIINLRIYPAPLFMHFPYIFLSKLKFYSENIYLDEIKH